MTRPTQHPAPNSTARKAETERRANLTVVPCCDAAAAVARVREVLAASGTTWKRPVAIGKPYTFEAPVQYALVAIADLRAALDGPAGGGGRA